MAADPSNQALPDVMSTEPAWGTPGGQTMAPRPAGGALTRSTRTLLSARCQEREKICKPWVPVAPPLPTGPRGPAPPHWSPRPLTTGAFGPAPLRGCPAAAPIGPPWPRPSPLVPVSPPPARGRGPLPGRTGAAESRADLRRFLVCGSALRSPFWLLCASALTHDVGNLRQRPPRRDFIRL